MSSPAPGLHWSISGGLIWVWISILLLNLSNLAFFSSLLWMDINPKRTSSLLFREPSLWPHFLLMEIPAFFIRVQLLYNVVLVSALSESATCIHIPILLAAPFHPLGCHRAQSWAPCDIQQVPNGYFTRGSAHVSNPVSQFIPSLLTPLLTLSLQHVHTSILSIWVSIPALLKHFLQSPGAIQKCFISVIKIFSSKSFRFFFF